MNFKFIGLLSFILVISLTFTSASNFSDLNLEIQDTINNGNTTLYLTDDYTYNTNDSFIFINTTGNFTIDGNNHKVDGLKSSMIFYYNGVETLTLKNLTLINGFSNDFGGGVYTEKGSVSIIDCNFTSNYAEINGGGIYSENGNINILNSIFNSNRAIAFAGAVNTRYGNLYVNNSVFTNNSARTGGAIGTDGKVIKIENSQFYKNSADLAGAICTPGELSVRNSIIVNNTAKEVNDFIAKNYPDLNYNWYGNNTPFEENSTRICTFYVADREYFLSYIPENWRILELNTNKDEYSIGETVEISVSLNTLNTLKNTEEKLSESKILILDEEYLISNSLSLNKTLSNTSGKFNISTSKDNENLIKEIQILNTTSTTLIVNNLNFTYLEDNTFTGLIKDANGNVLKGKTVYLKLTRLSRNLSKTYTVESNTNGEFSLKINLAPGEYLIESKFNGDEIYLASTNSSKLNIYEKIETNIITEEFKHNEKLTDGYKFKGTLKTSNSNLVGEIVEIKITRPGSNLSKTYSVKTDSNGEFYLEINLGSGIYPVICTYKGNEKYQATEKDTSLIISNL